MHVDLETANSTRKISDHFNERLNTASPNTYYLPGVIFMVCVIGLLLYANFFYEYKCKDAWMIIIRKLNETNFHANSRERPHLIMTL